MTVVTSERFNDSSPEEDRTVNFNMLSADKANEYNFEVFDGNGDPVDSATGTINFEAYSPGIGKPESPASTLNLATDDWKFRLFFATINRVVFSVTGLNAGYTVQATCVRGT